LLLSQEVLAAGGFFFKAWIQGMSMLDHGFIKIHRKLTRSFFYKDSEYVCLWIHCLLRANWEDVKVLWNGVVVDLKRGQFICGRKSISKELHINEYKVRRILDVFETAHQIKQQKTNKYTIITIVNYDKYQDVAQQDAHQTHIKPPTNAQQTHTVKEYKEREEYKEPINNIVIPDSPKSRGRTYPITINHDTSSWEGITQADMDLWRKAYPAVDIDTALIETLAYWMARPKNKRSNWKATINNRLKFLQDHAKPQDQGGIEEWLAMQKVNKE
jgi:hypothetical protein